MSRRKVKHLSSPQKECAKLNGGKIVKTDVSLDINIERDIVGTVLPLEKRSHLFVSNGRKAPLPGLDYYDHN